MSIVSMRKLLLVGHDADKTKLINSLHRIGTVEVAQSSALENTVRKEDVVNSDKINDRLMRLSFAFSFLREQKRLADKLVKEGKFSYTAPKKPFIAPDPRISYDSFIRLNERETEVFDEIAAIDRINARYADIKNEETRLLSLANQLEVYAGLDCKFSAVADTAHTFIIAGTLPKEKLPAVKKLTDDYPHLYVHTAGEDKSVAAVIIGLKPEREEIAARLNQAEFIRAGFSFDQTAAEKLSRTREELSALAAERTELLAKIMEYQNSLPLYRQMYDYYLVESAKLNAADGLSLTKNAFYMEAWLPESEEKTVKKTLEELSDKFIYEFRPPLEDEFYPTLIKSNPVVAPYEGITNMYSVPSVKDIDPNPFMAFFYFLMFGIMLGDAAYGIIIATAAFVMYKLKKPARGKGGMLLIIGMGGISTFIWGMLFGGWFSITLPEGSFLSKLVWFNPLDQPIMMLGLGLGIGFVQIMFGLGLKAVNQLRHKEYVGAIVDVFSWYAIFGGLIMYAGSVLLKIDFLKYAGITLLALGLAALLILGGYPKKGASRVIGGAAKLYNIVNFFSDILSYSRLFGLGLSSAVIGMVVNKIAMVVIEMLPAIGGVPIIGIIAAAPILIVGHLFNIGISALGTYVHNSRLQYIEFFGKFYEGAGHQFTPLGSKTKYNYIER